MSARPEIPPEDAVTIEIDGRSLQARKGAMIIEVADAAGIVIPRFCYHKKLSIAANCRMCMVEVEKVPKPLPAWSALTNCRPMLPRTGTLPSSVSSSAWLWAAFATADLTTCLLILACAYESPASDPGSRGAGRPHSQGGSTQPGIHGRVGSAGHRGRTPRPRDGGP